MNFTGFSPDSPPHPTMGGAVREQLRGARLLAGVKPPQPGVSLWAQGCSAHPHGLPRQQPPRAPSPCCPLTRLPCGNSGWEGLGGARLWAGLVPQQPHARCGPQVGGRLALLLCWDDLHGLVQAGLQAGPGPSGVVCVAGDAGSCKRAPRDGASSVPPRREGQQGTRPPRKPRGFFLHAQASPALAKGVPGRAVLRARLPGGSTGTRAMATRAAGAPSPHAV